MGIINWDKPKKAMLTGKELLTCTFGTTDINLITKHLQNKKGRKLTQEQKIKFSKFYTKKIK